MSQNQEYHNITTILDNPQQPITKQQIQELQSKQGTPEYKILWEKYIHRTEQKAKDYDEHRVNIKMLGYTTASYLLEQVLNVKPDESFIKIIKNNFGYDLEGMEDFNLWLSADMYIDIITVYSNLAKIWCNKYGYELVAFLEAPEKSKSVPEIKHYHLIISQSKSIT